MYINKKERPITSLRSDTWLGRTHVLTSLHLSGCVYRSLSMCLPYGLLFQTPCRMGMEVMTRATDDNSSQASLVPRFRLHQSYCLVRTSRSQSVRTTFLITMDLQRRGSAASKPSSSLPKAVRSRPDGSPPSICVWGVRVDELPKHRSHFNTQGNERLPWACLFPGSVFAASLARHQPADGAPGANVGRGWHPLYSSLAIALESKYHFRNNSESPTLADMLTGIWCPHGVLLRKEHSSKGICFDISVIQAQLLECTNISAPRTSEGCTFPSVPSN